MTPWVSTGDYKVIAWLSDVSDDSRNRVFLVSDSKSNEFVTYYPTSVQAQFDRNWSGVWSKLNFKQTQYLEVTFKEGKMIASDGVNEFTTYNENISPAGRTYDRLFRRSDTYSKGTLQAIAFIDLNELSNSRTIAFNDDGSTKFISDKIISVTTHNVELEDLVFDLTIPEPKMNVVESANKLGELILEKYPNLPIVNEAEAELDAVRFAWEGYYWMRTYINLYNATNDIKYIDWAVELASFMFNNTDVERAERNNTIENTYKVAPKYYLNNRNEFAPGWMKKTSTVSILEDGMVLNAIMRLVDVIKSDNLSTYKKIADSFMLKSSRIVDSHNSSWSETKRSNIEGSWYYVASTNTDYGDAGLWSNPRAYNHLLTMGTAMIYLDKWSGGVPEYQYKLQAIEAFFQQYMTYHDDGTCEWNYSWDKNGNEVVEDISHGHLDVGYFVVADKEGYLNDSSIPECMAKTVVEKIAIGPGVIPNRVDGEGVAIASEQIALSYDYRQLAIYEPSIIARSNNILRQFGKLTWFRKYAAVSEYFVP